MWPTTWSGSTKWLREWQRPNQSANRVRKWRQNFRDHFEFLNEYGSRETGVRPNALGSAHTHACPKISNMIVITQLGLARSIFVGASWPNGYVGLSTKGSWVRIPAKARRGICEQDTLKSTARGSQNKQNCLRHVPLTSVKNRKWSRKLWRHLRTLLADWIEIRLSVRNGQKRREISVHTRAIRQRQTSGLPFGAANFSRAGLKVVFS
jgi:hypothetical protein